VLLAAILWSAWERFSNGPPAVAERPSALGDGPQRQVYFGPPNSVAVLPFTTSASNPETAAEAEGFAAEILEVLIGARGLQVTARSSSFFFRHAAGDHRIIAERLQCRHLLGGEWGSGPDGVELALRLYDASSGSEIWRTLYSEPLPKLLAMREDISADVLAALPVPAQAVGRPLPHPDPGAWVHYAQGLRHTDPSAEPDLARATDALQSALAIDPGFAAARLELAEAWLHPSWIGGIGGVQSVADALAAVQAVLDEDPESARGWALMSHIRHQHDWDWDGAASAGRRAAGLRPGDASILSVASLALSAVGEFASAQELLEESVRRDPLNLGGRLRLGLLLEFRGEFESALATYRQLLSLNPEYPGGRAYRARVKVLQGKADSALRESDQEADAFWRRYARVLALRTQRENGDGAALMQEMIEQDGSVAAFQIAEILAFGGDRDRAFEWLDRAFQQRDPGIASSVGNRFLENLHADSRWPDWLSRLGLPAHEGREGRADP
jgi:TolB-like protein/cytochrome c-type biogenesis protein CcmH/NrfG